jgi:Tol biopolymer transport system component
MKRHYPLQIALLCLFISGIAGSAVGPERIVPEPVRISTGAGGKPGDRDSETSGNSASRWSGDGRYLVFRSTAANLSPDDGDAFSDIYLYDGQSQALHLLSRAGALGAKANHDSDAPAISLDGRFIAFSSRASNLDSADADALADLYLYDRTLGTLALISRAGGRGEKGNGDSFEPALSADGRYLAFASRASNLGDGDTDPLSDIHVYDRHTDTVELVSRAGAGGVKGNDDSFGAALSGDGRTVAFLSKASNLGQGAAEQGPGIYVYDRHSGSLRSIGFVGTNRDEADENLSGPSLSADGRYLAYSTAASEPFADIVVYDLQTGTEERIGRDGAGASPAHGDLVEPVLSADGRYVVFKSDADNLGDGDTDARPDMHVYDRHRGVLHWLSRPSGSGRELTGLASPAPSADGTRLAFSAYAGADEEDCCRQVFVQATGLEASGQGIAASDANAAGAESAVSAKETAILPATAESVEAAAVAGYEPSRDIARSNVSLNGSPRPSTYWGAVSDDSDNTWVDTASRATRANVTFGYPDVGALNNGQVTVRYRFLAGASSRSNVQVTVALLNGATTLGTSLTRTVSEGTAAFDYSETFTGLTISSGADLRTRFSWTRTASTQSAQLKEVDIDVDTGGACTQETDAEFCARLAKNCGQVTGTDNCGIARTVSSCGECSGSETCSSANICTIPGQTAPGSLQIPVTTGSPGHTTNVGLVIFGHSTSDQGNFPDKLAAALNANNADNRHYVVLRAYFPGDGGLFWTKLKFDQNDVNYHRVKAGTENKQWCTPAGSTDRWSCRRLNFEKAFNNGSAPAGANECATDNASGPECSTLDTALTNVSDCSYYSGSAIKGIGAKTSLLNASFRNCLDKMDVKIALFMDTTSPSWVVDDYNLDGDITDADVFDKDNLTNASLSPWQCPSSSGLVGTDKVDWDCDGGSANDPGDNPAKVYAGWLKSFATELISPTYNFNFVVFSQKPVERFKKSSQFPNEVPHPHNQRTPTPSRPFVQFYSPGVYWEHKGLLELSADPSLDQKIRVLSPLDPQSMWNKSATCYESGLTSTSWSIPLSVIDDKYEVLSADRNETDAAPETGCFKYIDHTHAYDAGAWMIADVWYNGLHPYLW